MATQIKITQLTDIGSANLAVTTLLPVVNMAGVPTTQKTTLGNLANVILSQAGGNYAPVATANIAYSVANAAQPNITSVGTLTNVTVSGNATINGNITSNGTAYVGNLSTTGLASITTLAVGSSANLGAVGNVKITGGTSGQILSTDGAGNLSWVSDANGGGYGNSNVATYLASYGSNTITTTGNVSVGNLSTSGIVKIGNATITEINPIVLGFTNDIYVGGDVLSQRLESNTGTVALNASNSTADTEWAFNVGGTLNLPQPKGNISTSIQSIYGNSTSFVDFVSNNSANFTFGTTANNNIVLITGLNQNDNRWVFGYDGKLTFPGTPRIDTSTNNFEVQAAQAVNFEANTVVNIYTDTSNNAFQWQFGDDGILTVPGNLVAASASPAPTISGFSSVSALSFASPVVAYANLPAATTAGQRAFISDANLVAVGNFGNVVGNGGSNTVCVWSDGTDWRIG